ncbi:MAG: NAD(P)/FAD-dependent oxidoreductase [Thermoprotei archaeon]|nr:FAD-dependent oxidoreductase [TACK group archaeon]
MRVAVLGAGATGLFAALQLARRGLEVVLIEAKPRSSGATVNIGGVIHGGARFAVSSPALAKLCASELPKWKAMSPDFLRETGAYFVSFKGDREDYAAKWRSAMNSIGISSRQVDPSEIPVQGLKKDSLEAAWRTDDALINVPEFLNALLSKTIDEGVLYLNGASWSPLVKGERAGVKVKRGSLELDAIDAIVNATGASSPKVHALLTGQAVPSQTRIGAHLLLKPRASAIIEKLRPPGQGDILLPLLGHSAITPSLSERGEREPTQRELAFLLKAAQELLDVRDSDAMGYMSAERLLYDQASSLSQTDLLVTSGNVVTAYSSNLACARAVGEAAALIVMRQLGLSGRQNFSLPKIQRQEVRYKKIRHADEPWLS